MVQVKLLTGDEDGKEEAVMEAIALADQCRPLASKEGLATTCLPLDAK